MTPSHSVSETRTTTFNRWLIPVGAVAVHICIGSVYAWSTFNRPIHAIFPNDPWWFSPPYTTFTMALLLLGLSAAFGGPWVERRGPRVAATTAAVLFGTGLVIGGVGLALKQSILVFLGMGVIGGIGCGLGYISPVSTLVKWFPDRRGMATGMAIMGFGGGAFLAGYLNVFFIAKLGVAQTVIALGVTYLIVMLIGARILRRPPEGWRPEGWTAPVKTGKMITDRSRTRNQALGRVQFYLLWGILFINVTAGIGILAQASPMMQDLFQKTPLQAAGVVSLISIFNAGGRLFWASCSDFIGRRNTYLVFFVAQFVLFLFIPGLAASGNWGLFETSLFIVFTMYGGGFATIPAFLADLFGPENVGAIHGALLTAWSAAAVVGPVIITELSNSARAALPPGASKVHIYDKPLEVLAALLAVGFVLTILVRPLTKAEALSTSVEAAGAR
jgi:MFS family permease